MAANGDIEKIISELDREHTGDRYIQAIMKKFKDDSVGVQNKYITLMSRHLEYYGKGELRPLLKLVQIEDEVEEELVHYQIADMVLDKFSILTLSDTEQIMVSKGLFYSFDIKFLKPFISNRLRSFNTNYDAVKKNVYSYIRDQTQFDRADLNYNGDIVILENGWYDIANNEFVERDKEEDGAWHYFYEVPHEYKRDKKYKCPRFKNILRSWLSGPFSKVYCRDIFEMIGLCMTTKVSYKTAFMIYGKKNTGKTQFFNILQYIIGRVNLTTSSLQRLSKNEFGTDDQQFKLLNYCPDLGYKKIWDTSVFKNATGGDEFVQAELKGGKKFKYKPTAKYCFNANKIPPVEDINDSAFFERFVLAHFCNVFKQEDKKKFKLDIFKSIIEDEDEIQGIIHESIKGLLRLKERDGFRVKVRKNSMHVWNYESSPAYAFIYDYCDIDRMEFIEVNDLYNSYTSNCRGVPQSKTVLTKELQKFGIIKKKRTKENFEGKRPECYYGICLKVNSEISKINVDKVIKPKGSLDRMITEARKEIHNEKDIINEYGEPPE